MSRVLLVLSGATRFVPGVRQERRRFYIRLGAPSGDGDPRRAPDRGGDRGDDHRGGH